MNIDGVYSGKRGRVCQQGTMQTTRRENENETKLLIFDCMMVLRGDVVFIYRWLVSNYLRCFEAVVPNMRSV